MFDDLIPAAPTAAPGGMFDDLIPPAGFGTREQREGAETDARQSEYLADAIRMRYDQDKTSPMGRLDAYARGVASWVPGMAKIAAAGDAALGIGKGEDFGDRYSDNLERQRAIDTADSLVMPGSRLTGQGAGLVATAAVTPTVQAVKEGGRLGALGADSINAGLTGGIYGAITGAVESDGGVAEKMQEAVKTGAVGTALGAVAPGAVQLAGKALDAGGRAIAGAASPVVNTVKAGLNPEREALRRVDDAFARDGVTDPAAALRSMQSTGAPAVLGDSGGETVRALARSAANQSPEGREALTNATQDRFLTQADRLVDTLRAVGPTNAAKTLDELQAAARKANAPAYRQAYADGEVGLWTDRLSALAQAPAVQDAFKGAIKTGANRTVAEGLPPVRTPFGVDDAGNLVLRKAPDGSVPVPNLRFWDEVQRDLASQIGKAQRSGDDVAVKDLTALKRQILEELDTAVPSFGAARSGAHRAFQAEDALEAGQNFVSSKMANNDALKALAKMKPEERALFAEGFRSKLAAQLQEIGDNRDVTKAVFNSPAARQRMEMALGKEQTSQFEAAYKAEQAMMLLKNAMGNSTTARQIMEMGLAGSAGGAVGYQQGGWEGATAGAIAGAGLRKGQNAINANMQRQIAEILASGDPAKIANVVRAASKSKQFMGLIDDIADRAAQASSLSGLPAQIPVRSGVLGGQVPVAAEEQEPKPVGVR